MTEKKTDWLGLIVTIIAIIVGLLTIYFSIKKVAAGNGNGNGNGNGDPSPPPPAIPEFFDFDITSSGAKAILYNFPTTVHLVEVTGMFYLKNTCPKCWFVKRVGLTLKAITTSGARIPIQVLHPAGGLGEGWHNFFAAPGLGNVKSMELLIDRYYSGVDDKLRITRWIGSGIVIK